jgi:hypothetical protein
LFTIDFDRWEGDHEFFLEWQMHGKVPINKHETHDGFSYNLEAWVGSHNWCTPKLLDGVNCESKGEDNGKIKSRGAFLGLQHFGGRGLCWSLRMGTRKIDK